MESKAGKLSRGSNQRAGGEGRKKLPERARKGEKRLKKNEEGLKELQGNMKQNNICIIGIPEGEKQKQRIENLLEN